MTIRTFHTAALPSILLALSLAACSLGAPQRRVSTLPPAPTRSAPLATSIPATPLPAATRQATATRPPAKPTPTQPSPTPAQSVPQTLEKRDLAVLSPANITQIQLLASFRPGPDGAVAPLLFSPDHSRLIFGLASSATQGGVPIYIWALPTGLPDHILQSGASAQSVPVLALSSDASILASASTGPLRWWTTLDWQPLPAPAEPLSSAAALDFNPTGSLLLAGSADGWLRAWESPTAAESWSTQAHPPGITALAFSHNGAWAVSAGLDGALRLWKAAGGEKERDLSRSAGVITVLAFLSDDQQVLSYAKDGQVRFWRLSDGHQAAEFQACSSGLPGCTPPAFSPDRRLMALSDPAAEGGPGIRIWDVQAHSLSTHIDTAPLLDPTRISALAFSLDGRLLAVGSQDGLVQVWGVSGTPFSLGAQLRVTDKGDGLNLRDRPALEGSIRSQLRKAETLSLLEGPILAGGFNWWRALTADGREGWIVEVPEWYQIGGP